MAGMTPPPDKGGPAPAPCGLAGPPAPAVHGWHEVRGEGGRDGVAGFGEVDEEHRDAELVWGEISVRVDVRQTPGQSCETIQTDDQS